MANNIDYRTLILFMVGTVLIIGILVTYICCEKSCVRNHYRYYYYIDGLDNDSKLTEYWRCFIGKIYCMGYQGRRQRQEYKDYRNRFRMDPNNFLIENENIFIFPRRLPSSTSSDNGVLEFADEIINV